MSNSNSLIFQPRTPVTKKSEHVIFRLANSSGHNFLRWRYVLSILGATAAIAAALIFDAALFTPFSGNARGVHQAALPTTPLGLGDISRMRPLGYYRISVQHDRRILVREDVIAPSTIDDIVRNAASEMQLQPLMAGPPRTEAEAASILARIKGNPIFRGKVSGEDGSLVAIYLPLHKGKTDRSHFLGEEIKRIVARHLGPNQRYYLAGLPLAENTFGNEMFVQMGVYAPAAN